MIAYHFPPIQGSSGLHRTLAFARYLPAWNWSATVLTVSPNAYVNTRAENDGMIPTGSDVVRAWTFDTVRHLSIRGRYLRLMALPDRWQSWIATGIWNGLRIIRKQRPSVIYSTFPIASAHAIGLALSRLTRLPWVADFRDPMDQITYPPDPLVRRSYRWIEQQTFRHAACILVTTPGTARLYAERYPEFSSKVHIIPNGFDPNLFPLKPDSAQRDSAQRAAGPLVLLHSGLLYPSERNPEPFLRAIARLCHSGDARYANLRVVFRGSGHEQQFADLVRLLRLQKIVSFPPALPYHDAVAEMLGADALLLFQAANCNSQIPAKAYEYLYSGRPVIGITDPDGDTGQLLQRVGVNCIARLEDENEIAVTLRAAIDDLRSGKMPLPDQANVMRYSREVATGDLAALLDHLLLALPCEVSHSESN